MVTMALTMAPSLATTGRTLPRILALLLPLLLPHSVQAILPTAAIDVFLPDTAVASAITLYASQASFGGHVAQFSQRYHHFEEAGASGKSRLDGVGVVPAFPPAGDDHLCNEAAGWADYSSGARDGGDGVDRTAYYRAALLVPRGRCSFERKALAAQRLGASALVIYESLGAHYSLNFTNSTTGAGDARTRTDYTREEVLWPADKLDYECDNGRAYLPASQVDGLDFLKMPGGYSDQNDALLTGRSEGSLCVRYDAADAADGGRPFAGSCDSQRCLLTGRNVTGPAAGGDAVRYEACCAWDLHVWLYGDTTLPKEAEPVTIPAVFVTMREASELLDAVRGAGAAAEGDPVVLSIYARQRPHYNVSAVLIWALGVCVAWAASYHSSADLRRASGLIAARRAQKEREGAGGDDGGGRARVRGGRASSARSRSGSRSPEHRPAADGSVADAVADGGAAGALEMSSDAAVEERTLYRDDPSADEAAVLADRRSSPMEEESLELTPWHALGFVVMSSTSLLVLFYFKIYGLVKVMYAVGCSGALTQLVVHPGLTHVCRKWGWHQPLGNVAWLSEERPRGKVLALVRECCCPVTPVDLCAVIISYGIGAFWVWMSFYVPHPDTYLFYWVMQDVFGLCMCVLFLDTIKLNAIKVGALLLVVAFFYDIFFVFVTPLLTKHGESIMINVATSGGPPKADPTTCEKYPASADCQGGDPLPMLFTIPRIGDYQGGSSMLGLGDIVLPGLLLSFASRYDESKRLMGLLSGGSGRVANNACPDAGGRDASRGKSSNLLCNLVCCCCGSGYYGPVMVGYAVGLLMANAAVYIMEMGQPALLYLVPCCLGTMVVMGHMAGELRDLWVGPRVIHAAERLMQGDWRVESAEEGAEEEQEQGERRALEGRMNNEEAEMT